MPHDKSSDSAKVTRARKFAMGKSARSLSRLQNPDDAEQGEDMTLSAQTLVVMDSPDDDYFEQLEEMGMEVPKRPAERNKGQRRT